MTDPLNLPLKLIPRFDPKPWGGRRLANYGFDLPGDGPIGEAVITPSDAVIAAGDLAGMTIQEVVAIDPDRVIGQRGLRATGDRALFPLLIKMIDAQADLSIQVHPDDDAARSLDTLGKTETYHVLASEPGSRIALGLLPDVTPDVFAAACRARDQDDLLCLDGRKHFVNDASAPQVESRPNRRADLLQNQFRVVLQCRQYALLVRVHLAVRLDESGWEVGAFQAPCCRSDLAREGQKSIPRGISTRGRIRIGHFEGEQRLDVRLGLAR